MYVDILQQTEDGSLPAGALTSVYIFVTVLSN